MASTGQKRKADFAFPDYVVKSLECPVCLETIKDPPVYLCEKGHALCQTCREPLKAQNKPCPVCRGKLTDVRNLGLEGILEQRPKIKGGVLSDMSSKPLSKVVIVKGCQ